MAEAAVAEALQQAAAAREKLMQLEALREAELAKAARKKEKKKKKKEKRKEKEKAAGNEGAIDLSGTTSGVSQQQDIGVPTGQQDGRYGGAPLLERREV